MSRRRTGGSATHSLWFAFSNTVATDWSRLIASHPSLLAVLAAVTRASMKTADPPVIVIERGRVVALTGNK